MATTAPGAVSVAEAARLLGISRATAYKAVTNGDIPSFRIGPTIRVPREALEALLAGRKVPA